MKTVTLSRTASDLVMLTGLAAVYFVAGRLGLRLAFVNASATPVWPSAGIGLAALLVLGYRVWPAILLGAFLVNITTAGSVAISAAIAIGNTLEGVVGAYLVNRYAGGRDCFDRPGNIFRFAGLAAVVSATISATWGATTLSLTGSALWTEYGSIWLTWWLGDAAADLVVTPVLVLWSRPGAGAARRGQLLEAAVLLISLVVVSQLVFGGLFPDKNYPLDFLCIPFLLWASLRFEPRAAATALLLVSGIAVRGSLWGYGPFVRGTQNESLLLLQAFLGVVSLMTLTMAAVVSARRRAAERLRLMSVTDPLTGLANYRQLITVLLAEINRSVRTGRSFAVLFLDLDRLKRINDHHGHLVGSRAICRVGEALRASCRAIDTAARYGGDEFAGVLPETG
ncbi:MAG TPA: MASE1 domain-containing protein, partial [Gemmatimonadales bacterium]|nr:MASE1 domain-containing protein [Gemmatimonadales bacterium]